MVKKQLDASVDKYTITEELTIFIGSWNIGASTLKDDVNLSELLFPKNKMECTPDIYCIGLQEIVELNANYVLLSSNQNTVDFWQNTLKSNREDIDK